MIAHYGRGLKLRVRRVIKTLHIRLTIHRMKFRDTRIGVRVAMLLVAMCFQ